ncbi:MAG TPA: SRPBCC domain-containing protein, partial [Burkholderiaceae bacterium]|nr:SRPBCC domain-containing protein [Burkholderiaceae bacterium]
IKKAGGDGTWDRLAEYLEKESSGKDKFVINRSFDAPLELLFQMWSDPKHLSAWLAPTGFQMQFIRSDIRPGGSTFYFMTGEGGAKMYGRAEYLAIEKPHRLVYAQQFCDENETVTRHPMSPTWPETMLTTIQLTEEAKDKTRVTITWEPHGANTVEEIETFVKARGGMTQGWTGSLDKLEGYLGQVI